MGFLSFADLSKKYFSLAIFYSSSAFSFYSYSKCGFSYLNLNISLVKIFSVGYYVGCIRVFWDVFIENLYNGEKGEKKSFLLVVFKIISFLININ